ncbi:hypothetical protein CXG81DRAFT_12444 [Caulochytrium protostelioides]|uniref:Six-hairpin glycosidase n=1 Tax=Caulochytrium protostelioides TaxID=1555241 RepID=A0A4P9WZK8_9FUNG|nr:Six-hairpin glycosidase [Caulochytrium protostelioides]RKP01071.1 hypothetical protein CXG81DRAFT_12444 [Caulochytrium protostelioides]|eukprot:RKP01071.1 hypothetical protein CXG81DRAFT_12444 [Caulochytrium protostelioides]
MSSTRRPQPPLAGAADHRPPDRGRAGPGATPAPAAEVRDGAAATPKPTSAESRDGADAGSWGFEPCQKNQPLLDRQDGYLPIEAYGVIGNMRTCSLIGTDGGLDFWCYPRFDSPTVFARLLDAKKGGYFHIAPVGKARHKQQYLPGSNILQTRFMADEASLHVTDFMYVPDKPSRAMLPWLIRKVEMVRGRARVNIECCPAFNYARSGHDLDIRHHQREPADTDDPDERDDTCITFRSHEETRLTLALRYVRERPSYGKPFEPVQWCTKSIEGAAGDGACATLTMEEDHCYYFILSEVVDDDADHPTPTIALLKSLEEQTYRYWVAWLSGNKYSGKWQEVVHRSALMLKLLTYAPTGAVIAAPTFGLPESIGGARNWDYRYVWIRDSAFTIYALIRVGFTQEAEDYMAFVQERCNNPNPDGSLSIMYTIDGQRAPDEVDLSHLEGYRGSRPVRYGNGAADHLQLDIYGALLDAIYLHNKYRTPLSYDTWLQVIKLVNYVCDNWDRKDMSIWEVRGQQHHFLFSKIMCWVAIDRGLRLHEKRSLPCRDRARWYEMRDTIYTSIMENGYSQKHKCFVQSYEGRDKGVLDAAVLIMPLVFFISPTDPRLLSTLDQILLPPERGGLTSSNMVLRYDRKLFDDGLDKDTEGSFSMCTFWLIESLTRSGKYQMSLLIRAVMMFEQMIGYGNHVNLFSEEVSRSGQALGNFPQAFTHIALMSAAFNLDRALKQRNGIM